MFFRKYYYGTLIEEYEIYTSTQRFSECPGTGFGTVIDPNGVKYEGDFVNYKRYLIEKISHSFTQSLTYYYYYLSLLYAID
jgi:hypothetical protein